MILGMDANEALNGKMITWAELRSLRLKRMLLGETLCASGLCLLKTLLWETLRDLRRLACTGRALWSLYARSRLGFAIHHGTLHPRRYVETSTSRTKTSYQSYKRNKSIMLRLLQRSFGAVVRDVFDLLKKVLLSAADDQPLLLRVASGGS